ncbi:MAG: sulfotransferase [Candidatus Woesebacteria bacterium]
MSEIIRFTPTSEQALVPENIRQLRADIALAKRRIYRFSENLEEHVLIEELEGRSLSGGVAKETHAEIVKYLDLMAQHGSSYLDISLIAERERIDLQGQMNARLEHKGRISPPTAPEKNIFIVGSPRSGTTHLFNLLSFQRCFSYFTNFSHHVWSSYNLSHLDGRKHFQSSGSEILTQDSKKLRLLTDTVIPDESEHIFNRYITSYSQLRTHQYLLSEPVIKNPESLVMAASEHAQAFESPFFLSKSPFNSFRIPQLQHIFNNSAYFIHIHRNGYAASQSIATNGFKYFTESDSTDDPAIFWGRHISAIMEQSNHVQMVHIPFEDLLRQPTDALQKIFDWLGIEAPQLIVQNRYDEDNRLPNLPQSLNTTIERYNALLGYE